MKEAFPLAWPDGWVRTRAEKRRGNYTWKKTFGAYRDALVDEVQRLKAQTLIISTDVPLTLRGLPREGFSPPDPGVAVYFEREEKQDVTWRDVLGIGEIPPNFDREQAIDFVDCKFRELSKKHHPDVGGEVAIFQALLRARNQAKNFVLGKRNEAHEYVLACDLFHEVRLNMHAIGLTIEAMRQIERCGASSMLERAFRGFMAALPARGETA